MVTRSMKNIALINDGAINAWTGNLQIASVEGPACNHPGGKYQEDLYSSDPSTRRHQFGTSWVKHLAKRITNPIALGELVVRYSRT